MSNYKIEINETQRLILIAALESYPRTEESEDYLLVDLRNLKGDHECVPGQIWCFVDSDGDQSLVEEAMLEIQNAVPAMKSDPQDVLFVIETDKGFWNEVDKCYRNSIEHATGYSYTDYPVVLGEMMEEIVFTDGGWFKVVMMAPAEQ